MVSLRSAFAPLIACALFGSPARAQSPADLERRFFAAQAEARTVVAEVTQTLALPGSKREVVSRAEVFFVRPDRLVIRYVEPAGDSVLLLGDRVITRKGDRPPTERPLARDGSGMDSWRGLLEGRSPEAWTREWDRRVARDGDSVTVTLTPRSGGREAPRAVTLTLDVGTLTPRTMEIALRNGARLNYRFDRFRRNAPVPDGAFDP